MQGCRVHDVGTLCGGCHGFFSPRRFTQEARRLGLRPGIAVDLEEMRPDGSERWNLDKESDQTLVEEIINTEEPELLTGSPLCEAFS